MKAIILAAGKGTRLHPLTCNRPKPLLEVGGKTILGRVIEQVTELTEDDEIRIVTHTHHELVNMFLEDNYGNLNITTIYQEKPKGTADALNCALEGIEDDFIVVFGDVIFERGALIEAYKAFWERKEDGVDAMATGVALEDLSKYGVFSTTREGIAKEVIEKPLPDQIREGMVANAGFFVFPPEIKTYLKNVKPSQRGELELTEAIEELIRNKKVYVHTLKGAWFDVGYPWSLLEANRHLLEQECDSFQILGTVEEGVKIHGKVHVAKSARIRSGTYIEGPAYFDEGADIGPNTYIRGASYFGKNSRVGNACEVKNSIIYAGTHAAHLSYIGDSILGEKCNLGAGTITANLRHDNMPVKVTIKGTRISSGRRKLGVIMGDNVKTGIGVSILPGVKIGCRAHINADETVNRDVPDRIPE